MSSAERGIPRRGERLSLQEMLGQMIELAGGIDAAVSSLIGREITGPPTKPMDDDADRIGRVADLRRGLVLLHGVLERVQGGLKILEAEL